MNIGPVSDQPRSDTSTQDQGLAVSVLEPPQLQSATQADLRTLNTREQLAKPLAWIGIGVGILSLIFAAVCLYTASSDGHPGWEWVLLRTGLLAAGIALALAFLGLADRLTTPYTVLIELKRNRQRGAGFSTKDLIEIVKQVVAALPRTGVNPPN